MWSDVYWVDIAKLVKCVNSSSKNSQHIDIMKHFFLSSIGCISTQQQYSSVYWYARFICYQEKQLPSRQNKILACQFSNLYVSYISSTICIMSQCSQCMYVRRWRGWFWSARLNGWHASSHCCSHFSDNNIIYFDQMLGQFPAMLVATEPGKTIHYLFVAITGGFVPKPNQTVSIALPKFLIENWRNQRNVKLQHKEM